jgi:hypothetical protein
VRRLMRGPLVPAVVVSGSWAIGEWYGAGGGETLFRRRDGRWTRITMLSAIRCDALVLHAQGK